MKNNKTNFDVVILGGGPAGSAAGLTLLKRDDISVAIIEKSDYQTPRIGESLSPGIRPLLEYLDIWQQFSSEQSLLSYGSKAAWGSSTPQSLDYMFTLHGTGWGLDRVRFDRMLANSFSERGGHLLENSRANFSQHSSSDGWKINIKDNDSNEKMITAKYLIDASGRRSLLANQKEVHRTVHDKLVGITCIGQYPENIAVESMTQVEACEYGWWYTSPVPGNKMAVVLMTDSDISNKLKAGNMEEWHALLDKTDITKKRVANASLSKEIKVFPCFSSCLKTVGGDQWVAVGDAVASHDPLSSSGIPHAIGSGVQGALVAADAIFSQGKMLAGYQESIHQDFIQYLRTHWQYYTREQRWSESLFWKRRIRQVNINPMDILESTNKSVNLSKDHRLYLPSQSLIKLYDGCQLGKVTHEVVSDFSVQHPNIPEQHIIMEIQGLIENGYLKVA